MCELAFSSNQNKNNIQKYEICKQSYYHQLIFDYEETDVKFNLDSISVLYNQNKYTNYSLVQWFKILLFSVFHA